MSKENMRILVVDDEVNYCEVLKMILTSEGYSVDTALNGQEALSCMEKDSYDIVVSDLNMPVMDGYELLKEIRNRDYDTEVIMLTAFGTIKKAVETMKAGAYTYVTKGSDPEELLLEITKVDKMRRMNRSNRLLKEKMSGRYMLESRNPAVIQTMKLAERAAESDSNILILGESGAGKEVLASFIHDRSARSEENFLELNCQSLSESILESELFGHEKGAFTGADKRRIGHFEATDGGTMFLDEIGGVSSNLQAKLLRAIENKVIYRLGSSDPVKVDFRLITATNRNLKEDMDNELFRVDLFYRISTIVIEIPPLRERREDIPLFIDYFIEHFSREMKKPGIRLDDEIRRILEEYDYPGNIRELKNIIERLQVLSDDEEIRLEYLPQDMFTSKPTSEERSIDTDYTESLKEYRKKAEKAYIEELISRYPDDMNQVAEILSITRRQLLNKQVEYGLK